jgi:hypothetical protein
LKKLEPAKMDPSRRTECLERTRTDVLTFIIDWASDLGQAQNVLLLHGLAGSGKSTVATTVANRFREQGRLGAFLFFDRQVTERSDPTIVVRTLAYQIGSFYPQIGTFVSAAIDDTPTILLSPIVFQFHKLLVDILPSIAVLPMQTIVLILDGLDECATPEDRRSLVKLLSEETVQLPPTFRIIITSRPDADIRHAFESQRHILLQELDLYSTTTTQDISTYFRHHMNLICAKKRDLATGWPGDEQIRALTDLARGLFVWASTACRFIDGHDPKKRLEIILERKAPVQTESTLDILYRSALGSVLLWDDEDFVADFRTIIGMVLVLRNPLSCTAIDTLLGKPNGRSAIDTILQLGCVVSSSPTVRIIHPSFSDFLSTRSRCGRDMWFFQIPSANYPLATNCLHNLNQVLRQNICNLTLSADTHNATLPEDVEYACLFWIDHVCNIKDEVTPILESLDAFLDHHLLHWFEAMSILKRSRTTIMLLNNLLGWITVSILSR